MKMKRIYDGAKKSLQYFQDAFKDKSVSADFRKATNISGTSQKLISIQAHQGADIIMIEIVTDDDSTYVNYAGHSGK